MNERLFPTGYPKRNTLTDNNVDTSEVAGASADCVITSIRVGNDQGTATDFSLEDNASTPNNWFETAEISANGALNEQFPRGLFCEGGFDYQASAAGLDLQIEYWTKQSV